MALKYLRVLLSRTDRLQRLRGAGGPSPVVPALPLLLLLAACSPGSIAPPTAPIREATDWISFGGDPGGQRYSKNSLITLGNVGDLAPAWTYHTGDVSDGTGDIASTTAFENTPILADGTLYLCTPFNRVIALDPATGDEKWVFDPRIDLQGRYANQLICRGVTTWQDDRRAEGEACRRTIFTGTNDARLIALDAKTGRPCEGFGKGGEIDLNAGAGEQWWKGEYQVTSPPAVVGDVVVVGSAVSDNARTDAPSGVVRGFDARTGKPRWSWDLAPPGFDYESAPTSDDGFALGTPNVWSAMAVDERRNLLFVPTGNAAPDYYRGPIADMNFYGSSVVALNGSTGEVEWHYATVHNDLWDYDVPAQPTLTTVDVGGRPREVVVQATKMGILFILDLETGKPIFPVEERPVPQGGAAGERLAATQPFPTKPPPLARHDMSVGDVWGFTPWDRGACREEFESLRYEGIYTPPTEQGSIVYPGNAGGSNWGGIAVDPDRQIAIVRTSDLPFVVTLIPRASFDAERKANPGIEHGPQIGTPYGLRREVMLSPLGVPCNAPPWGTLAAVDLRAGTIRWQIPLGTLRDTAPIWLPMTIGMPGRGGPIATAGGVVFVGAAMDDYLRAIDIETGEELWKGRLPAGGQATPMTYRVDFEDGSSRQYVVIAAGGHGRAGTRLGDSVVAFAIERTR